MSKDTPINERLAAKLVNEQGSRIEQLIEDAVALANGRLPFSDKASGLMDIAEALSTTITPYTPCVKGCNHCCYMAVSVSVYEAEMISRYTGKPLMTRGEDGDAMVMRILTSGKDPAEDQRDKYTGVACTLLAPDGKCSVYPVRPMACRTHHNLGMDESNCVIAGKNLEDLPTTPAINLTEFQVMAAMVMVNGHSNYADVREFFPK